MSAIKTLCTYITKLFPLWIIIVCTYAFFQPELFNSHGKAITYLLGLIMLSMGLTMSPNDFKLILSRPKDVVIGIVGRYIIMPGIAFALVKMANLPEMLAAGIILIGCCPSGTSSNVMTFLAKGDAALSVTVSSVNTLLAPILTPYIFLLLAGSLIPIDATALLLDILKVVILPIIIGVTLRAVMPNAVKASLPFVPAISVLTVLLILAIVVAINGQRLVTVAGITLVLVVAHNTLGYIAGYGCAKGFGLSHKKSKAISFEIGIENSALAVALAMAHLDPVAAVPGAIFSIWECLSGSVLASYWASRDKDEPILAEET